jgi:hypothetical protein
MSSHRSLCKEKNSKKICHLFSLGAFVD